MRRLNVPARSNATTSCGRAVDRARLGEGGADELVVGADGVADRRPERGHAVEAGDGRGRVGGLRIGDRDSRLGARRLGRGRGGGLVAGGGWAVAGHRLSGRARRRSGLRRGDRRRCRRCAPARGVAAAILAPGAALMFVNVGYVALLAFGGASAGTALVVPVFAAGVVAVRTLGGSLPDRLGGGRTIVVAGPLAAAGLLVVALGGGVAGRWP